MEIEQALREHLVVELEYDGGMRLVEPHALFLSHAGDQLVRVWQVDGFTHHDNLPGWRSFRTSGLSEVRVLRTHFSPRPDRHAMLDGLDVASVLVRIE